MSDSSISRDAVYIDKSVHEIYKQLTEGNDPVSVPFRTMKDVFLMAASLGYQKGVRQPLTGKRELIFRWAQFSPQTDLPLLKALAISTTSNIEVLVSPEEIVSIAQEYANAGIHELRLQILEETGQPLLNIVQLLGMNYR
jgi:dnd system-associated protein 4